MADYSLKRWAGTTIVPESGKTSIANIELPGKNYLGYGNIVDQALLNMVENFANTTPPTDPIIGQFWYDAGNSMMKYYKGPSFTPNLWADVAQSGGNITGGNITGVNNLTAGTANIANLISANAIITGGSVTGLSNLTSANGTITNLTSANANIANLTSANASISGGNVTGLTNLSSGLANIGTGNIANLISANASITGGNITGLTSFSSANGTIGNLNSTNGTITNLTSGNVTVTGGNVTGLTNLASTNGNIVNLKSSNADITGGNATGLTNLSSVNGTIGNLTSANGTIGNLSSGNATITGGNVTGLTNLASTNGNIVNLKSSNADITGGNATGLTNLSSDNGTIGNLTSGNVTVTGGNVTGLTNLESTNGNIVNLKSSNADITGGNVTNLLNLSSANGTIGNLTSGNVTITGGNISANIAGTLFHRVTFATTGGAVPTSIYDASSNLTVSWNTVGAASGHANGWANVLGLGPIPVANLKINDNGIAGQVLSTDGAGTLSWITPATSSIGSGSSNISVITSGNVGISAGGTANVLVVTPTGANIVGTLNATGNANVGNIGATNGVFTTVTGSLTTAAQPNITSVGTLTSLNVSGNATAGNLISSGNINATGNIQSDNDFIGNALTTRTGPLTLTATGTNNITLAVGTGNVNLPTSTYITNVKDPVSAQDAATKNYVDLLAQGLKPKASVQCATTAAITLAPAPAAIDGHTLVNGDRVLVKNQAAPADNGIYSFDGTNLVRATDADSAAELPDGTFVFIENGTTYSASAFTLVSVVNTLGTDPVTFVQFSTGGTYTAGSGLALTGTQFSLGTTAVTAGSYGNATHAGTFTVDAQGRLTAAAAVPVASLLDSLTDVDVSAKVDKESGIMWDATAVSGGVTGQWVSNKIYDASPTGGTSDDF